MEANEFTNYESLRRKGFNGGENHVESKIVADSLPKRSRSLQLIPMRFGNKQKR
jgi:hypothetical protein